MRRQCVASGDAGAAGGSGAAAQVATLIFAGAAPDSTVLVRRHREVEALFTHAAVGAYLAGTHQHANGLPGISNRKEQLRVGVAAIGVHPPGVVSGTEGEALSEDRHSGNTLNALGVFRKGFLNYFRGRRENLKMQTNIAGLPRNLETTTTAR